MSMSKKDFELVTQVFQDTRPEVKGTPEEWMWLAIRNRMLRELDYANRSFQPDKFERWTDR